MPLPESLPGTPAHPGSLADAALVAAFRAGDRRAFDALYDRYAPRVWGYARHLTGVAADAEDLTQETWVAALAALPGYRADAGLLTFLLAITTRRWRDTRRARTRRPATVAETGDPPGAASDPAQTVAVRAALAALPDDKRAAFLLIEHLGLTYAEAARTLAVPQGVVRWRVTSAAAALRRALSEPTFLPVSPLTAPTRLEVLTDV